MGGRGWRGAWGAAAAAGRGAARGAAVGGERGAERSRLLPVGAGAKLGRRGRREATTRSLQTSPHRSPRHPDIDGPEAAFSEFANVGLARSLKRRHASVPRRRRAAAVVGGGGTPGSGGGGGRTGLPTSPPSLLGHLAAAAASGTPAEQPRPHAHCRDRYAGDRPRQERARTSSRSGAPRAA